MQYEVNGPLSHLASLSNRYVEQFSAISPMNSCVSNAGGGLNSSVEEQLDCSLERSQTTTDLSISPRSINDLSSGNDLSYSRVSLQDSINLTQVMQSCLSRCQWPTASSPPSIVKSPLPNSSDLPLFPPLRPPVSSNGSMLPAASSPVPDDTAPRCSIPFSEQTATPTDVVAESTTPKTTPATTLPALSSDAVPSALANVQCHRCGLSVGVGQEAYLLVNERHWHTECLVCCVCGKSLQWDRSCFFRDGFIYCRTHYDDLFICPRCNTRLQEDDVVIRASPNLNMHERCFNCGMCGRYLKHGDRYLVNGQTVICTQHKALLECALAVQSEQQLHPQGIISTELHDPNNQSTPQAPKKKSAAESRKRPTKKSKRHLNEGINLTVQKSSSVGEDVTNEVLDNEIHNLSEPQIAQPAFTDCDRLCDIKSLNTVERLEKGQQLLLDFSNKEDPDPVRPLSMCAIDYDPQQQGKMGGGDGGCVELPLVSMSNAAEAGSGGGCSRQHSLSSLNGDLLSLLPVDDSSSSGGGHVMQHGINESACISSNDGNSASTGTNENSFDYLPEPNHKGDKHSASSRQKRLRTSFKHQQLRIMKSYFEINHNPDAKDLRNLSQRTGLPKRVLQVWFQNARAKHRRLVAETGDSPIPGNSGQQSMQYDGCSRDMTAMEADNFSLLSSVHSPCTEPEMKPNTCVTLAQPISCNTLAQPISCPQLPTRPINFAHELGLDFGKKLLPFDGDSNDLSELFHAQ